MPTSQSPPLELPAHLLSWLSLLARESERARSLVSPGVSAETLASLAAELPAYLEGTVLRAPPEEPAARAFWREQLRGIAQARQGALSLDPVRFPWAPALAEALRAALEQRPDPGEPPPDDEEEDDVGETRPLTPLEKAWRDVRALRYLTGASPDHGDQGWQQGLEIAKRLREEPWAGKLLQAARGWEADDLEDEELRRWVAYGLEARLRLQLLEESSDAPELFEELDRVDQALASAGPALTLLPAEEYADLAALEAFPEGWASWREEQEGSAVAFEFHRTLARWKDTREVQDLLARALSWVGAQVRLTQQAAQQAEDARLPRGRQVAAVAYAGPDDTRTLIERLEQAPQAEHLDLLDQIRKELQRVACPWLRQDLRQAVARLATSPRTEPVRAELEGRLRLFPGSVPLLVAFHETSPGEVLQLRVKRRPPQEPGDPWQQAGWLLAMARDAIRTAFEVAASRMPHGMPPAPFEEHVIELIGADHRGIAAVDGGSLGLAAALGFLSLWLDRPLPPDLACSASLRPDGQLWAVGYVQPKAQALARLTDAPLRLLLARAPDAPLPATLQAIPVATVDEAMASAGFTGEVLREARPRYRPWLPGVAERVDLLQRYHHHVESQSIEDYRGKGLDPWLVLGDRIRLLVRSLAESRDAKTLLAVNQGRIDAALAFTHALDDEGASEMLQGLDTPRLPGSLAVYAGIVELGKAIDSCTEGGRPWADLAPLAAELETKLKALPESERIVLEGRALGTIGRAWMHQRQLPRALEYLRRSVASHDQHLWQEAGRSRIYLATALRMSGALVDAARTQDEATRLLDRCREEWSAPYAESSRIFWCYEEARLMLELERPLDALALLESQLPRIRQLDWWPLAGVLRTMAWCHAAANRPEQRAEALRELDTLASRGGALLARLKEEAAGPHRRDGEVY